MPYGSLVNLISSTTTNNGLTVIARLDETEYEKGRKFTKNDMESLNIHAHDIFPNWNYSILPRA